MNQQDVFSLKIEVEQLVPPLFFFSLLHILNEESPACFLN